MNLIEGERNVLVSPMLTLTSFRVCQDYSYGTTNYTKQIRLSHITGCELTVKRFYIWLVLAIVSAVFFIILTLENNNREDTLPFIFISPIIFTAIYYFAKVKVLTISSPSLKIIQKLNTPESEARKFIDCLHEQIALMEKFA